MFTLLGLRLLCGIPRVFDAVKLVFVHQNPDGRRGLVLNIYENVSAFLCKSRFFASVKDALSALRIGYKSGIMKSLKSDCH